MFCVSIVGFRLVIVCASQIVHVSVALLSILTIIAASATEHSSRNEASVFSWTTCSAFSLLHGMTKVLRSPYCTGQNEDRLTICLR